MEKQLFTFKIISQTEPMNTDPFWAFIGTHQDNSHYISTMVAYLQTLGFNPEWHKISEQDSKTLRYIFTHFHDMKTLLPPQKMEDLFLVEDAAKGWPVHVRFNAKNQSYRYNETKLLQDAINDHRYGAGSYEIITTPDGTITLWFKYQQILGSVRVCEILPE